MTRQDITEIASSFLVKVVANDLLIKVNLIHTYEIVVAQSGAKQRILLQSELTTEAGQPVIKHDELEYVIHTGTANVRCILWE